jgi:hypothetical protein
MYRLGIKYGFIASVVLIMWVLLEHEFGFNSERHDIGQYTRLGSAFLFYVFIFLSIRERKKIQRGNLLFPQGFKTGSLTVLIYGVLSTCWFWAYMKLINPKFFETVMDFELTKLQKENASAAEVTSKMDEITLTYGGSALSFIMLFVFTSIVGLLVALLFSYLLKSKKTI